MSEPAVADQPNVYGAAIYNFDDRVLDRVLHGGPAAGDTPADRLTPDEMLSYSAWWRAAWLVAATLGQTDCQVKKLTRTEQGETRESDPDHPAADCLTTMANPEETAAEARMRMGFMAVVWGNAFAKIVRTGGGYELYPYRPGECWPERVRGVMQYRVNVVDRDDARYDEVLRPDEVFVLKNPICEDGLVSRTTHRSARYPLYEGLSGAKVRSGRAKNAGRPAVVLETEQSLNPKDASLKQDDFQRIHQGFDGIGKPAVLDKGLKAKTLPYTAEFAAEAALANIPLRDVANYTGVPSVMLGDTEGFSFEVIEALAKQWLQFGAGYWFNAWRDQAKAKLLGREEWRKRERDVEFDVQSLLWANTADLANLLKVITGGAPVGTINDARAKLGMPPSTDPNATKILVPLNIGQGGSKNDPANPADPGPGRPAAAGRLYDEYVAGCETLCRRLSKQAWTASGTNASWMKMIDRLEMDEAYIQAGAEPLLDLGDDALPAARAVMRRYANGMLEYAGRVKTQKELHDGCHDLTDNLELTVPEAVVQELTSGRAR